MEHRSSEEKVGVRLRYAPLGEEIIIPVPQREHHVWVEAPDKDNCDNCVLWWKPSQYKNLMWGIFTCGPCMSISCSGRLFRYQSVAGGGVVLCSQMEPPYADQGNQDNWNCWHPPLNNSSRQTPDKPRTSVHVGNWLWFELCFCFASSVCQNVLKEWLATASLLCVIMFLMGSQEMSKLCEERQQKTPFRSSGSAELQLFMLPISVYSQWHRGHAWVHLRKAWTVWNLRNYDHWSPSKIFTNAATHNT